MLALHRQLSAAQTPHDKTLRQRQAAFMPNAATDAQIDRLVHALYDLTDEEIAIVEEATV